MRFSKIEIIDLLKAWIAISIAFAIVFGALEGNFLLLLLVSGLSVGFGFLLHELGHKFLAQKYGCWAEFRSDDKMLLVAIAVSFLGFVFAAPGAVLINGNVDKNKNGKISMLGPLTNLILAVLFLLLVPKGFLSVSNYDLRTLGFTINSWLALFNLIPLWFFDGRKIFDWNKVVYFLLVIIAFSFVFLFGYLNF